MSTATLSPCLAETLRERALSTDRRMREVPFFRSLLAGEASREDYAAWLVQLHKYVRLTERMLQGMARATAGEVPAWAQAIHGYATWEHEEEAGHAELILADLAALWDVSPAEALGRIELTPSAPAVELYRANLDAVMHRYPLAPLGVALALETLATLHSDPIREHMLSQSRIEGIRRAMRFFAAHSSEVEEGHSSQVAARIRALPDPQDQNAVRYLGQCALAMYEAIPHYLEGLRAA